jgi:hypothetical protein
MSTQELIQQITEKAGNVPDSILQQVLDILKTAENKSETDVAFYNNLKKILEEDKELLERLAK